MGRKRNRGPQPVQAQAGPEPEVSIAEEAGISPTFQRRQGYLSAASQVNSIYMFVHADPERTQWQQKAEAMLDELYGYLVGCAREGGV